VIIIKVDISNHEFSIVWDGVYYHALSNYPNISEWELCGIIKFVEYEKHHGRAVEIFSDNQEIMRKVNYALTNKNKFIYIERPEKITECTACKQKGCITKYLCHTASVENALSIIKGGNILSAVKARNIPAEQLKLESRNAAKDPVDYFEHVMLSWGNCQAGDRLVMERELGRMPNEEDLSCGFTPGIRFFFKYDELLNHPNAVFDGYHPLKIRDELILKHNVLAIIIPEVYREKFEIIINCDTNEKVHYLDNKNKDVWEWSNVVYDFVSELDV
jgi:hypothetical protein